MRLGLARSGGAERTLVRIAIALATALALATAGFTAFYLLDQRVDSGPSLAERQVVAAEAAVVSAPNALAARMQLAAAYRGANRPTDALAQYDEILTANEAHRGALLGRGAVLMELGRNGDAAVSLEAITRSESKGEFANQDPQLEEAYYRLATIDLDGGDAATAVTRVRSALAIEPTDADAWYLLGRAQLATQKPADAVDSLRRALVFVPLGWCEPYETLAQAYTSLARPAETTYATAMVDLCRGRAEPAEARLRTLTSGPLATDALVGLGLVAEAVSDRDGAIAWYRKVLGRDPQNRSARTALDRLGTTSSAALSSGAVAASSQPAPTPGSE
jgi:tetratricopeptide (TPR) repeat protein